jgi:rifampin ADP-ribosylating transferase
MMTAVNDEAPTPFEVYEEGTLLHGTKADLAVGDLLVPGRPSNFEDGRIMNHVYVTATLDAATWGAELAAGDGPGRIYVVEPTGPIEDDPNVTDKKLPGNPTRSYRTREPVRVVGEIEGWTGHSPEQLQAMTDSLADLRRRGAAIIYD